jgi:hypothetical protein
LVKVLPSKIILLQREIQERARIEFAIIQYKRVTYTADKTTNTNVGFVNILARHEKLWMNRRVRGIKLKLDFVLGRALCISNWCH